MRHTLTHDAMTTTFQIVIASDDAAYARQATAEAFAELDRIEARLSRFAEGGDIWRINRLGSHLHFAHGGDVPNEDVTPRTFIHHDTLECLRLADRVRRDTSGAFDIAYEGGPGGPQLAVDEANHTIRALAEGVCLDLGGIGKGFALDRMAALLKEWEIGSALLCASTSTLLALDPPPGEEGWAAQIGPDESPQHLKLANQALSASGLTVKGSHIIDPRTGRPAERRLRAWAVAPSAAMADALSTAFMVMSDEGICAYCRRNTQVMGWAMASSAGALVGFRNQLA